MFKQIPKSNISNRNFKVYKEWATSNSAIPIITAFNESGSFDINTSTQSGSYYVSPLYNSIKTKYYESDGNVITQFGVVHNVGEFSNSRTITDTIQVIHIPQLQYGEQIKKGSIVLTPSGSDSYFDDKFGNLTSANPVYTFQAYNNETEIMNFTANGSARVAAITSFDLTTGIAVFTITGITSSYFIARINFETNEMEFSDAIVYDGSVLNPIPFGNVFYDDGLLVLTTAELFHEYTLTYNSTQTIHETEVLLSANKGEFNFSQNPSAVNVVLENEYDFETTAITNVRPAGTVRIKEIQSITRQQTYNGTVPTGSLETGSWDDYLASASIDPTGSYLSTYITTIGIYDSDHAMVAVAKLPKPIKKLPDYNVNFIVRLDT